VHLLGREVLLEPGGVAGGDLVVGVVPDGVGGAVVGQQLLLALEPDPQLGGVPSRLLRLELVERGDRHLLLHHEPDGEQRDEHEGGRAGESEAAAHSTPSGRCRQS
jgi:hypothetical protein